MTVGRFSLVVGDFDGDAKFDLAVLNHSASKLSVLLGRGDGTRTAVDNDSAAAVPVLFPWQRAFNRDGKLDMATVNHHTDKLSVLLGKGDATFVRPLTTRRERGR